jgi:N6-L-threonylcarbamoyladenine synthase
LYLAEQQERGWIYENTGQTRDDAAGEAFDKVAKLLALGYPGGPIIDKLARHGNPHVVKFPPAHIKGRPRPGRSRRRAGADHPAATFDFSYSGIKTAVLRYTETHNMQPTIEQRRRALAEMKSPKADDVLRLCDRETLDLVASFQRAMVADLVGKTLNAARELDAATLFITGGVAANSELRAAFEREAVRAGLPVYFPSRPLSTDNAAMIAAAAYPKFLAGDFAGLEFSAEASLPLK